MQIQSERIPQYLKDNGRFCNWKYELRDGKQTKVPYTPGTTRRASVSDQQLQSEGLLSKGL